MIKTNAPQAKRKRRRPRGTQVRSSAVCCLFGKYGKEGLNIFVSRESANDYTFEGGGLIPEIEQEKVSFRCKAPVKRIAVTGRGRDALRELPPSELRTRAGRTAGPGRDPRW